MVEPIAVALVAAIVFIAGLVAGLAGFGFSLLATVSLTIMRGPQEAVAIVLPALLAVNLSLASELDRTTLTNCTRRFYPLIVAVTIGGVVGLFALDGLPTIILVPALVIITVATIISQQELVSVPFQAAAKDRCFVEHKAAMVGVGGVAGIVFGATNIGLLVIAYLKSCSLPQSIFAGVVGISLVTTTVLRFGLGLAIGLYPSTTVLLLALGGMPIAALGTFSGTRLENRVPKAWRRRFILTLLAIIAVRLSVTLV